MKKIKMYAVLINGRGESIRREELSNVMMDDTWRISQRVYRQLMNEMGKLSRPPKAHYWMLFTEDDRKVIGVHYGSFVRFGY